MRTRRTIPTLVIGVVALASTTAANHPPVFAAECPVAPDGGRVELVVGEVGCLRIDAGDTLGALAPFSYFIPTGCANPAGNSTPAPKRQCPVLYHLHGTGQSYRTTNVGLGPIGRHDSAYVRALISGPPGDDPDALTAPWEYGDPATWEPKESLEIILIAPHGLTLPGGFGPGPHQNPFWFDWNPRYAQDGDSQRYDTPPPRFETFVVDQLVPFVDAHFPAGDGRQWRGITGYSMGGFGALSLALKHPDVWSSAGMISGGTFPFPAAHGEDPVAPVGLGGAPGVDHVELPGIVPTLAPEAVWDQLYGSVATVGFGDFAADNIWWRQTQPADFVSNAQAYGSDGRQSLHIKYHVNDAVPRETGHAASDPEGFAFAQFFETVLMPTNLYLESVFERYGVERTFEMHVGNHYGPLYQHPHLRSILEEVAANLAGPDSAGARPDPTVFSYRSVQPSFDIWGWTVSVEREAQEFLDLRDVTCHGLSLQGTGVVTVTVPASCGTGVDGSRVVTVDLGPSHPIDEPLGAGSFGAYGTTATVTLEPLD
jgi:pimeloyl-ACP methyl ester carboxylesterase